MAAIGNYKLEKGRLLYAAAEEICLAVRENGLQLLEIFMIMMKILKRLSIGTQRPKYDLYNV